MERKLVTSVGRRLRAALVLGFLAATFVSASQPACAQTLSLTGPNVVYYNTPQYAAYPLINDHQQIWQGTPLPNGGCVFTQTGVLSPGAAPIAGEEIAYNPDTCQDLVDVGTPTVNRNLEFVGDSTWTSNICSSSGGCTTTQSGTDLSFNGPSTPLLVSCGTQGCSGADYSTYPGFIDYTGSTTPPAANSNNQDRAYIDVWYEEPAK